MTFGGSSGGKVVNTPFTTQDTAFKITATDTSPTSEGGCVRPTLACGTFLTKWGSTGSGDGQFDGPRRVAADGSG